MTDPIDASRPVAGERRRNARRNTDPAPPPQVAGERANFPVPVAPPQRHEPEPEPDPGGGAAVFAAQVIGQDGQKRGLRGGAPVLNQARAAYLGAEFSGPNDRRPPAGTVKKADV